MRIAAIEDERFHRDLLIPYLEEGYAAEDLQFSENEDTADDKQGWKQS